MAYGVQNFQTYDTVGTQFDTKEDAKKVLATKDDTEDWRVVLLNFTCTDYECNCTLTNETCAIYY